MSSATASRGSFTGKHRAGSIQSFTQIVSTNAVVILEGNSPTVPVELEFERGYTGNVVVVVEFRISDSKVLSC